MPVALPFSINGAIFLFWFHFPLPRAEHRWQVRIKRVGLFEASEFRHAPSLAPTRRIKRGTGVFFWFVFFHVEENEQFVNFKGRYNLKDSYWKKGGWIIGRAGNNLSHIALEALNPGGLVHIITL